MSEGEGEGEGEDLCVLLLFAREWLQLARLVDS